MATKDQVYHDQPGRLLTESDMVECIPAKRYRQMMEKLTAIEDGSPATLRIEALRAAAMLNAAVLTGAVQRADEEEISRIIGTASHTASFTTEMADHFIEWLSRDRSVEAQP